MRKIISFMHMSLDGFVAGPSGEMDWITVNDEIFGHVEQRISKGDTALYGRHTFEMMEGYWPTAAEQPGASRHDIKHSKWYKGIRKMVLSNTMQAQAQAGVTVINGDLRESLRVLQQEEGEDVLVFGSPSATHSLLRENLIDGYWLFVNPVLLGEGIPLFKNVQDKTVLKLLSTRQFDCGVTELNYKVNRS